MESLEIRNFLTIRHAKLDVRRFTILIGPQASGKSVVAKLLYFFRNFLSKHYIQSIQNQETKRQLERRAVVDFEQIFPRYAWSDQEFTLSYSTEDVSVSLSRQGRSSKKLGLEFNYSQNLADLYRKAKSLYKRKLEKLKSSEEVLLGRIVFFSQILEESVYNSSLGHNFQHSVFIPASRSFFANLQKNVFSFLANSIVIDPFIKEFGSVYEPSKSVYHSRYAFAEGDEESRSLREEVKQESEKILAGQYVYEDDQDWIVSGKKKINLANASSGQQEVLPLLVVLSARLTYTGRGSRLSTFFIEEPEAHLFPVSQRRIIGIFSRLYKTFGSNFLLTTHSPYILTALNNLIMASNLVQERESVSEEVKKIIGEDEMIRFEDVAAYTIENGSLKSILDSKSQLIGSSIIDSVSNDFDRVFDRLMEIELQQLSSV